MATFNNGESGSSVRAKINAVLQHADGTAGEIVFNDAGADVDFRIESDTNANALFLDGATGNVGVGTSSPGARLHAQSDLGGVSEGLRLQNDFTFATAGRGTQITFRGTSGGLLAAISGAASTTADNQGSLTYSANGATGFHSFTTSNTERMRLDASGNLGLGVVPSAWGASFKAVQVGATGALADNGVGDLYLLSNARYDGANWRYLTTNFANYYAQENGVHQWHNAPSGTAGDPITFTQAMTLDASGNLGIGTTSIYGKLDARVGTDSQLTVYQQNSAPAITAYTAGGSSKELRVNGFPLTFSGNGGAGAEHARIDSSGNLLVGITAFAKDSGGVIINSGASSPNFRSSATLTNGWTHLQFHNPNGAVGSITTNGTATSYNTSSDYRLKEDLRPIEDALSRLAALNPVNFAWKADGTRTDGFIAHEVQAVAPQAVTGEKDGEAMQAIDHSKLVPLLTAALQEALTKIEALEARIIALEA